MRGFYAPAIASNLLVEIGEAEQAAGGVPALGSSGSASCPRRWRRGTASSKGSSTGWRSRLSCHQRSREYYLRERAEGEGGER